MSFPKSLSLQKIDECLWFHHRKIAELRFLKNDIKHLECTVSGLICDSNDKKFGRRIVTVLDALMYLMALDTTIELHENQIANLNAMKVELHMRNSVGYEIRSSGGVAISKAAKCNSNVSNFIHSFSEKPHSNQSRLEIDIQTIKEDKDWETSSRSSTDGSTDLRECVGRPIPTIQTRITQQRGHIMKPYQRNRNLKKYEDNRICGLKLLTS